MNIGFTLELDSFSLLYKSENNGGSCVIDEEQLVRVTKNHIHAFFDGEDDLENLILASMIKVGSPFSCEDETTMTLTGSATYATSDGVDRTTMDELLSYIYRTRNSYVGFLQELGWEDLVNVSVVTASGEVMGGPISRSGPIAENESDSRERKFLITAITVPFVAILALNAVILVCRQKGCCNGSDVKHDTRNNKDASERDVRSSIV